MARINGENGASNRGGDYSASHIDLCRAPYVLYGVKYIGLVSLWRSCASNHGGDCA